MSDGFKVGSARIYQLFSGGAGESSSQDNSSSRTVQQQQQAAQQVANTDAVKISPAVQQEQIARASKIQELKQKVQSGEYSKSLKAPGSSVETAKKMVEFYSA